MKPWPVLAALALLGAAPTPAPVSLFVVAHEDDWQLFMNPDATHALDRGGRAVFVHLTAGDGGRGTGGVPVPFYRAREEGALRAIRFLVNSRTPDQRGLGSTMRRETVTIAGHHLLRVGYGPVVAYFLRLPDGNGDDGQGYASTGHQSLDRLRTGASPVVTAIDGSARYRGWADLTATLAAILAAERTAAPARLHAPEPDPKLNPGDHDDHRNAGRAAQTVVAASGCVTLTFHDGYDTANRPMNVTGDDLLAVVGAWGATTSALADNGAPSTWGTEHNAWLTRQYHRPARSSPCARRKPNREQLRRIPFRAVCDRKESFGDSRRRVFLIHAAGRDGGWHGWGKRIRRICASG